MPHVTFCSMQKALSQDGDVDRGSALHGDVPPVKKGH